MTRAPASWSMSRVASVDPESTATISSARPRTDSRVRPIVSAEFLQTMETDSRIARMVEDGAGVCGVDAS